MQISWKPLSLVVLLTACSARQANEGEDDSPAGTPEWSPCVVEAEIEIENETCAAVCASQGTTCVANGCPAVAEFCRPKDCDMATQALALDTEALCADALVGRSVAAECDAPVDWLFSNTLRCCCAED